MRISCNSPVVTASNNLRRHPCSAYMLLTRLFIPHQIPRNSLAQLARRNFSVTPRIMANVQEWKLKGISSLDFKDGHKQEAEVEGIEEGKVLLVKTGGKVHATSPKCTHYGAPLVKGVVSSDGRLTCPWHGACFKIESGDVEDAPALGKVLGSRCDILI